MLPIGSALIGYSIDESVAATYHSVLVHTLIFYLGNWYVLWAGAVRLSLADLRQNFAPGMTLTQVFGIAHKPSEQIRHGQGFANVWIGFVCLLSLPYPQLVQAGALSAGLF